MARKKKRKGAGATDGDEEVVPAPKPAPAKLSRPFADALRGMKVETKRPAPPQPTKAARPHVRDGSRGATLDRRPAPEAPKPRPSAPLEGYEYADRAAFQQAFAGVRPLAGAPPKKGDLRGPGGAPNAPVFDALDARDEEARRRLDRLVAGELRFEVVRDEDGGVTGRRSDAHPSHLRALAGSVAPQASLDLHGLRGAEAERDVSRFVREHHQKGERVLLLVHGKGRHSAGEIGVLLDHAIRALTEGGAAPYVLAFRGAPERLGGRGALVVRLRDR